MDLIVVIHLNSSVILKTLFSLFPATVLMNFSFIQVLFQFNWSFLIKSCSDKHVLYYSFQLVIQGHPSGTFSQFILLTITVSTLAITFLLTLI